MTLIGFEDSVNVAEETRNPRRDYPWARFGGLVMASRLLYGMSNEGILPRVFGRVHGGRRTPYVSILATTALAMILISTGDLSDLADMTVFLLLGVFIAVNVSVLVLRRHEVDHRHFRAPTVIPVIGAIVCLALMLFETEGRIAVRSLFILAAGAILYLVARGATAAPAC